MDGLTEGRIVHYVMPNGDHRPAIVVHVCPKEWGYPAGACQLQVFTDGSNDGLEHASGIFWATSVHHSESPVPHTWHWIERA